MLVICNNFYYSNFNQKYILVLYEYKKRIIFYFALNIFIIKVVVLFLKSNKRHARTLFIYNH